MGFVEDWSFASCIHFWGRATGADIIPRVRGGFVEFLPSWLICLGAVWSILAVYSSISGLEMAVQVFLRHVAIFQIIQEIKISC